MRTLRAEKNRIVFDDGRGHSVTLESHTDGRVTVVDGERGLLLQAIQMVKDSGLTFAMMAKSQPVELTDDGPS
jgi:hypothetical protein